MTCIELMERQIREFTEKREAARVMLATAQHTVLRETGMVETYDLFIRTLEAGIEVLRSGK